MGSTDVSPTPMDSPPKPPPPTTKAPTPNPTKAAHLEQPGEEREREQPGEVPCELRLERSACESVPVGSLVAGRGSAAAICGYQRAIKGWKKGGGRLENVGSNERVKEGGPLEKVGKNS